MQATPDYVRRYDTWLRWFEEQGIEAVGFGWINLSRTDATPTLRFEEWPWEVEPSIASTVHDWGVAVDRLAGPDDAALMATRLRARADVQPARIGDPGAEHPPTFGIPQNRALRQLERQRRSATACQHM